MSSDDRLGLEEGIGDLSDEFGDFGDDLDDGFDDNEFGGFGNNNSEKLAELEDHVGELENEVNAISSGMNAVHEKNRQVGETVEELDGMIRRLLDIYEIVTRDINPFVDDTREMDSLDGGGAFDLFGAETEDEEYLGPKAANADAEPFFDDDFGELDAEEGAEEAEPAAEDEFAEAERESPTGVLNDEDDGHGEAGEADKTDDADGVDDASLDDLKERYREGDGWDNEDNAVADDAETDLDDAAVDLKNKDDDTLNDADPLDSETADDAEEDDEPGDEVSDKSETDPAPEIEDGEQGAGDDVRRTLDKLETEYATAAGAKDGLSDDGEDGAVAEPESSASVEESGAYLAMLPSNYVSEMFVLEWAEYLVTVGGALGVSRALRQYRERDWISRAVESELNTHAGQIAPSVEDTDDYKLHIDDHQTGLAYVCRLAENVPRGQLYEKLVAYRGRFDGIRC